MYSHGIGVDLLDKESCRAWAQRIRSMPEGFTVFKRNAHEVVRLPSGVYADTLSTSQLRDMRRGYENAREAVGDDIDIAVHCHGEFDTLSSIGIAKAVAPMNPLWIEDPMPPVFSEGWVALRRSTNLNAVDGGKARTCPRFSAFS